MGLRDLPALSAISLVEGSASSELDSVCRELNIVEHEIVGIAVANDEWDTVLARFKEVFLEHLNRPGVTPIFLNLTVPGESLEDSKRCCLLDIIIWLSSESRFGESIADVVVNRDSALKELIRRSSRVSSILRNALISYWDDDSELHLENPKYRDTSANESIHSMIWFRRRLRSACALGYLDEQDYERYLEVRKQTLESVSSQLNQDNQSGEIEVRETEYTNFLAYQFQKSDLDKPRLTVYFNGAIDPIRAAGKPVYQRKSWWSELPGDAASIPDPTQAAFPDLALGWGQGTKSSWGIVSQAAVVAGISAAWREHHSLTSDEGIVILYGSSGGGFQALAVGTFSHSRQVLVNNPQIDWLKYEGRTQVRELMRTVYGPYSNNPSFRTTWDYRISVLDLWRKVNYAPEFSYVVNSASRADLSNQVSGLLNFWNTDDGSVLCNNSQLRFYYAPVDGHNPLVTRELLELIGW